jgi:hypothetical protein
MSVVVVIHARDRDRRRFSASTLSRRGRAEVAVDMIWWSQQTGGAQAPTHGGIPR